MGLGLLSCIKIKGCYQIQEKIGSGRISAVYRVQDLNGVHLAAKFVSKRNGHLLEKESKAMHKVNGSRESGTPYWHYYGVFGNKHVLVMDLLGESLWNLRHRLGTLSLKSALIVGIQMTTRVEALHQRGYIHCDINPYNFLVGHGRHRNAVYLTSYGLVTKYRDENGNHKQNTEGITFRGSKDFAPRNAHRGEQHSRRSDLESVLYTIIYLTRGLPWQYQRLNDLKGAAYMKENISAEGLCRNLPVEILKYYCEVRDLEYSECPNYSSLREYLQSAIHRSGYSVDDAYEWNT